MPYLQWDQPDDRRFESGVDRGVLYPGNGEGIPWNGLVKVDQMNSGASITPLYYEGVRHDIANTTGERTSKISAFTYPDELDELMGYYEDRYGILYGEQPSGFFSVAYRTMQTDGYKINVLMNQRGYVNNTTRSTHGSVTDPVTFTWDVSGVPMNIQGHKTTEIVFDSRRIDSSLMSTIEEKLYGSNTHVASMSSFIQLMTQVDLSNTEFVIIDSNADTWTLRGPDDKISFFEIKDIQADVRSDGTYTLYDYEEK